MPITCQIESLLSAETSEETVRAILLDLTPEKVDLSLFTECVHKFASTAVAEFSKLSKYSDSAIDCCGTGGSGIKHFNTSTASAFVLAASDMKVAKFGNRSASGPSGSFDILSELGFAERVPPESAERIMEHCNLVFLYAPQVYPTLARLAPIRKSLQVKTVLNFMGPLLNPVNPKYRLIGVSDALMQLTIANHLARLQTSSMVVRGECGLDEFCPSCETKLLETSVDAPQNYVASNVYKGFDRSCPAQEAGEAYSRADLNAKVLLSIFNREDTKSTPYKLVCLNAGAAMFVRGKARSIEEGRLQAAELISSGAVKKHFEKTRSAYEKYAC